MLKSFNSIHRQCSIFALFCLACFTAVGFKLKKFGSTWIIKIKFVLFKMTKRLTTRKMMQFVLKMVSNYGAMLCVVISVRYLEKMIKIRRGPPYWNCQRSKTHSYIHITRNTIGVCHRWKKKNIRLAVWMQQHCCIICITVLDMLCMTRHDTTDICVCGVLNRVDNVNNDADNEMKQQQQSTQIKIWIPIPNTSQPNWTPFDRGTNRNYLTNCVHSKRFNRSVYGDNKCQIAIDSKRSKWARARAWCIHEPQIKWIIYTK